MSTIAVALIAIAFAPFAIYLTLKRPLIFPFGLYILIVPLDGILGTETTLPRLMAIMTGCALVFYMILNRRVLAPPKSWYVWAAYVLLASLTALWTIDSTRTILTLTQLLQLFVFFTVIAMFPAERKDVRIVGGMVVASGVLISGWGLLSYLQGFRTQEDRLSIPLNGYLIDPNHIAAAILLPTAVAIGTLLSARDLRIRLGSLVSSILLVAAIFLTGSRGGLIALSIMLLYIAWRTRYRLQILGLMAFGGLASLLQPTVWGRFADKGLGAGSGRLFIWDAAKLAFKDHWLIGAGIGAFPAAYNHELLAMFQPVFQGWSRPAHNAYLSAAVEVGILGGVLHLFGWWNSWKDSRGNVVIEAGIIGLAVASFFLDVLEFKYIWLAFTMAVLVKNVETPQYLRGRAREPQLQPEHASVPVVASRIAWLRRRRAQPPSDRETIAATV